MEQSGHNVLAPLFSSALPQEHVPDHVGLLRFSSQDPGGIPPHQTGRLGVLTVLQEGSVRVQQPRYQLTGPPDPPGPRVLFSSGWRWATDLDLQLLLVLTAGPTRSKLQLQVLEGFLHQRSDLCSEDLKMQLFWPKLFGSEPENRKWEAEGLTQEATPPSFTCGRRKLVELYKIKAL